MRLITDREQANVTRLAQLSGKSWDAMTAAERAEWSGDPLTATAGGYTDAVNLLPPIGKNLRFRDGSIIADAAGTIVIGDAADFSGVAVTLSTGYMSEGGSLALMWSDGSNAGGGLTAAGSVEATLTTSSGTQLVLQVGAGYYGQVMLELGRVQHEYVPYTEVVPTRATKGAYNHSDFNRVERAVAEIAESLGIALETKTDWTIWDVPTASDTTRYLSNVTALRDACNIDIALPESLDKLTYSTANAIERVLVLCRAKADAMYRCGDLFSGEVI